MMGLIAAFSTHSVQMCCCWDRRVHLRISAGAGANCQANEPTTHVSPDTVVNYLQAFH
jgi:hypothetical protein